MADDAKEIVEGGCSPAALLDHARPEDAPLHALFNWGDAPEQRPDDPEAAT